MTVIHDAEHEANAVMTYAVFWGKLDGFAVPAHMLDIYEGITG